MSEKNIENELSLSQPIALSKNHPKRTKRIKHIDNHNLVSSNLLAEIKSIAIPELTKDKKDLLIKLKETIVNIDKSIQLLIKKKDYYKELVNNLEIDLQKENEIQIKNKLENSKLLFIRENLNNFKVNDKKQIKEPNNMKEDEQPKECSVFQNNNDYEMNMEDFNDMENCQGVFMYNNINHNTENDVVMEAEDNVTNDKEISEKEENSNEFDNKFSLLKRKNKKQKKAVPKKKNKTKTKENDNSDSLQSLSQSNFELTQSNNINSGKFSYTQTYGIVNSNLDFPDFTSMDEEHIKEECKKYGLKTNGISLKNLKQTLNEIYIFINTHELPQPIQNNLSSFLNNNTNKPISASQSLMSSLPDDKKEKIISLIQKNRTLYQKILLFQKIDLKEIKSVLSKDNIIISNDQLKDFVVELGVILSGGWN